MTEQAPDYDPHYLAGILLFNAQDYFEAHEVWEELWHVSSSPERQFYQGLIQAAVGLCHLANGNHRGARKLYHSCWDYLKPYAPRFLGLDVAGFGSQLQQAFRPVLEEDPPQGSGILGEEPVPVIVLDPPPATWPDPAAFVPEEDS